MLSKLIVLVIILNLPFSLGCATTESSGRAKKDKSLYNISTTPPGAKIVVSKFGKENHEYISPSAVPLINGCGFIEISKDGYWEEDRLVMESVNTEFKRQWGDMGAGAIAGGVVGALIMAPYTKDLIVTPKTIMNDQTRFQLDILDHKNGNPSSYNSDIITDNIDIKLIEISATLKPVMLSLKIDSEKRYRELSKSIEKLHSEGKISKEELLRAKKKFNDIYYGKFQRKN